MLRAGQKSHTMTTKKQIKNLTNKVEWQTVEYDADCSDVEGLSEMPCPVAPSHQNYPIQSVIIDVNFSLEFFEQLRENGELLPADILKISQVMQTFRRELSSVLEVVSSRHTPARTTEDPVTVRQPTDELSVPTALTGGRDQSSLDSGYRTRGRNTRPKTVTFCANVSTRKTGTSKKMKKTEDDSRRLMDSAYGSSLRSQTKPQKSSEVKHKSKHKKEKEFEPTETTELEPTLPNKELKKVFKKIRKMFRKMLNGSLSDDSDPGIRKTQKKISDLLALDPDFPLMKVVEDELNKLY